MSFRSTTSLVLMIAVAACSHAPLPQPTTITQQGTRRSDPGIGIDPRALRRDLFAFADDSFRGRETGSMDAQRAAAFLARRIQQLGLEPAGDSMYMQRVPLVREVAASSSELLVSSPNGQRQSLTVGSDLLPVLSSPNSSAELQRTAAGDLLFVGFGPTDESAARAILRFDPAGKVLVALHGVPKGTAPRDRARLGSGEALSLRVAYLKSLQPAAVIVLLTSDAEDLYSRIAPDLAHTFELDTRRDATADSTRQVPMVLVGLARRGSPLLPAGWPNDDAMQMLGRQFSGRVDVERKSITAYNVAAVVRGHDPRLNKTYLAYGAHYDHIGIVHSSPRRGRRVAVDSIANGADDDGSGSVALLAIAQQMMAYRPRRSVLFVWHVGEEKGMLGSAYYTSHSTVPIDSIVTEFNADMIGRNADTLALIGPRAAPNYLSWRVGIVVDSVNRAMEQPLHIDRKYDDPDDPEHIYERSDHYNYARKGIPVIFFTSGLHDDYHRVTDEASKIDYDKLARVSQLMFEAGLAVANRSSRPTSEALIQSISNRQ